MSPLRIVPHLAQLSDAEYDDLWRSVRIVQRIVVQGHCQAEACNVAVQDGIAAGQSVPHVHVHILPRTNGDLKRNDDVYDALEVWEPRPEDETNTKKNGKLHVPGDEDRRDRTAQEMQQEAETYRALAQNLDEK